MKKLSKEQIQKRDDLVIELNTAFAAVEEACVELVDVHIAAYNAKVTNFNEVLAIVRAFVGEITADMESFIDEKSERWQDSEAGQLYTGWKEQWDDLEMEDMDLIEIEATPGDSPQSALPDALQELSVEPE